METQENINVNGEATGNNVASTQEEIKTYTQEEVLALLQSESDKRVQQALETTLQLKVLEHPRKYILKDKILKRNFYSNQLNAVLSR